MRGNSVDRHAAMQTFVSVVDAGSFSGAARQLGLGQPAVSKAVAQLEARLGVALLLRSTRTLLPTEAGRRYYEHARRALDAADAAEQAARGAFAALTGQLRVCAAVTFARLHLVPALQPFLDRHPGLELDLILDDRIVDLLEEGLDVALRMGALDDSALVARRLAQSPRRVLGTPAYFARAGRPQTPDELAAHQTIVYAQRGGGDTWTFRRAGSDTTVAVSGRLRVSAAEGIRAAVLAGLGLTVASEWMFAPELADGTVQPVLTDWTLPPVELWAVFPSGRRVPARVRAFVDFVSARFAAA